VPNKWLEWTPKVIEKAPDAEPSKPTKPGFDGFVGSPSRAFSIIEGNVAEAKATEKVRNAASIQPPGCPAIPAGVRLIRWEPKTAPVAIDVCSVVVDVQQFIEAELRDLDSRLNFPWTIRGGWTIPQILDRLRQAGVEVGIEIR
jgi:hypothetical protein